jgi:hypothetical protein
VYTMPVLLRNIGLSLLLSSFGVGALFSSSAQVEGITRVPIPQCLESNQPTVQIENKALLCETNDTLLFFHLPSLRSILEPLGVAFLRFDHPDSSVTTRMHFPGAKAAVEVVSGATLLRHEGKLIRFDKNFADATEFFLSLKNAGLPITLQGWNNTELSVGKTKFSFGTPAKPLGGYPIFSNAIMSLFPEFGRFSEGKSLSNYTARNDVGKTLTTFKLQIPTAKPDDFYAVMTREKIQDSPNIRDLLHIQSLTPNAAGKYELTMYAKSLSFKNVFPDQLNIGEFNGELEAALFKFNGRLDLPAKEALTVLEPSQFSVQK